MNRSHIKWTAITLVLVAAVILTVTLLASSSPLTSVSISPTPTQLSPIATTTEQKQSPSTQPKIIWSATSIEAFLSPGETTSRTITFTSSLPLRNVHIKLKTDKERKGNVTVEPDSSLKERDDGKDKPKSTSSVKSLLKIEPDRFANVPADRPQTVLLSVAIPANTALGTYAGIIALRSNVDESDKDDDGDNDNDGKTLPQLKVVVNVWSRFDSAVLSFVYPPFSTESRVLPLAGTEYDFQVYDASRNEFLSTFVLSYAVNTSGLRADDWFREHFDPDSYLTNNGVVDRTALPNGNILIEALGGLPSEYTEKYGLLPYAFLFNASGQRLVSIAGSQENPLPDLGYSQDQVAFLMHQVIANVVFH